MSSIEIRNSVPRFCIAGAGAIGLTLATRLAMNAHRVELIARGQSLSMIKENGTRLIDLEGDHRASVKVGQAIDFQAPDVLFLCCKAQDLQTLASECAHLVDDQTLIVPVINGIPWWYFQQTTGKDAGRNVDAVDPDGLLNTIFPPKQIIGAVTTITVERVGPGVARSANPLSMVVGEINHEISERASALALTLTECGIETRVSERIRDALWAKVIANLIANPLSVLTGAPLRDICGHPSLSTITRRLLDEGLLVAAAYGARIELDPDALLALGASKGDFKTSMLQDFERGQPLELSAICDAVIELAQLRGIAMPLTANIAAIAAYRSGNSEKSRAVAA
ncbi:2-dehydropantoate 2-reductase [Rhizobium leguminosarum]|uniref:ketopantoate reductase family protein n=1 Tax=Rhizobium TaxID=379 RepID=UPI0010314733|nr:2-dehydropantoate 2-reductase [Rhizobium leguminosarum]TBF86460.1 2-dehydropantoate 2-reductase [Rhizobium leguminosarum]TBG06911.1 2-dehydropantoate 2-reductase [Rhizobium leguminosarum]TBG07311.1 2-dehydropantoate 2-reductase [Rhizobium leguminosarum]TBG29625.1 2-dehydropantoate 2-reductase [Rhizobium leguminosarum]TBG49681.1 2-dehydropantoate 2-reductase [Rhizobium leguminosarum]